MVKSKVWNKHIEKMRGKIQSWGTTWVNLAGKTILIKALLSALLIYQFAIIMAPASAHKQMELIIRGFLWQGKKQESKRFSLVHWDQVTLPFEKGGISIRIPGFSNNALGIKLVWRILNGKDHWWGEALLRKYLNCQRSKMLTEIIPDRPCTQVWKLIKKIIPQVRDKSPRTRGMGTLPLFGMTGSWE